MKRLLVFASVLAFAQWNTPKDVVNFLSEVAGDLSNPDSGGNPLSPPDANRFMSHFDPRMPGYATLRDEVSELAARGGVGMAIEVADESGDERKRVMQLDWSLEFSDQAPRRKLIKCTIEKQGRKWKFVALEPINFFKY